MSRKAQALPLNTVILAILVVLVLFVVGAFFLGGTGGIAEQIRSIFYQGTAGQDRVFAVQTCQQRCDSLKLLPVADVAKSAFCSQSFFIDEDNDGEADCTPDKRCPRENRVYKKFYCYTRGATGSESLGVSCPLDDGRTPEQYCAAGIYRSSTDTTPP
ncbi:hypothetical protein HYS50_03170 [Candidatus Woesearchaeota archaeon]|nr:hypothetical protein [Candidatus Woesearchaeota archaeon]